MVIISFTLHDQAFEAQSLTNATRVLDVENHGSVQSIQMCWKPSMNKVLVFSCFRCNGVLSTMEAMCCSKLKDDMSRQSLDAGFEKHWTPRFCQRGAANTMNGMSVCLSQDEVGTNIVVRKHIRCRLRSDATSRSEVQDILVRLSQEDHYLPPPECFLRRGDQDQLFQLFTHISLCQRLTNQIASLWQFGPT